MGSSGRSSSAASSEARLQASRSTPSPTRSSATSRTRKSLGRPAPTSTGVPRIGSRHYRPAELAASRASWIAGRGAEAAAHADRVLALTADAGSTALRAEALVERARLLMLAAAAAAAVPMATEGLELSEELGIERLQASALV